MAANNHRVDLALLAVQDTKRGIVEDKIIKNHFAGEYTYAKIKDTPTVGVVRSNDAFGKYSWSFNASDIESACQPSPHVCRY